MASPPKPGEFWTQDNMKVEIIPTQDDRYKKYGYWKTGTVFYVYHLPRQITGKIGSFQAPIDFVKVWRKCNVSCEQ